MMLRHTLAAVAALVSHTVATSAYVAPPQPPNMPCTWTDESIGTTYDLNQLMPFADNDHPATVSDRIMMSSGEYKYTFGVCTTVSPPAACRNPDGSSLKSAYWAPAWQTKVKEPNPADPSCYYIGSTEKGENGPWYESHTKWSLLSPEDPAAGVSIEFIGGHHCSNGDQRKLRMNFRCVKHGIESFDNQVVDEGSHCGYNITVDSHFACPTQCGFGSGRSACGDHGVCGYDTDMKQSRCFCNTGWTGSGCGDNVKQPSGEDTNYGPVLGLLVVVVIVLAGFGAAGYLFFRWMQGRTMNISGDSYSKLEAQYGDSMVPDDDAPPRMGISTGPSNI